MRIQSYSPDYKFQTNQIKKTNQVQNKAMRELSSGKKVNRAADDAAVLSISKKMLKQIGSLNQGSNNIREGINLVNIADGAMSGISETIGDLEVNSIRAMNGTMSASDRQILQNDSEERIKTVDHIATATKYNEKNLLVDENDTTNIHRGTSTSYISGANVTSKSLGLDNFSVEDPDKISTKSLDEALNKVSSTRSKLGAQANGLEHAYNSNQITAENTTAAESRMTDADMFDAIVRKETNNFIGAAQNLMLRNQMKINQGITTII